jgi:branched-chain amino acid transport system ATP-binding protein
MIALIRDVVVKMKAENVAIVLVEQRIEAVLEIADRVVFLENGRSADTTTPHALKAKPEKLHQYLGV